MTLQKEFHSKLIVTQNGMSLKRKCHSNLNATQIGMSLKLEGLSNSNVNKTGMSLKLQGDFFNWSPPSKSQVPKKIQSPTGAPLKIASSKFLLQLGNFFYWNL